MYRMEGSRDSRDWKADWPHVQCPGVEEVRLLAM
jgi:hypothetical protein